MPTLFPYTTLFRSGEVADPRILSSCLGAGILGRPLQRIEIPDRQTLGGLAQPFQRIEFHLRRGPGIADLPVLLGLRCPLFLDFRRAPAGLLPLQGRLDPLLPLLAGPPIRLGSLAVHGSGAVLECLVPGKKNPASRQGKGQIGRASCRERVLACV